jgi:hypothetical protein
VLAADLAGQESGLLGGQALDEQPGGVVVEGERLRGEVAGA